MLRLVILTLVIKSGVESIHMKKNATRIIEESVRHLHDTFQLTDVIFLGSPTNRDFGESIGHAGFGFLAAL